MLGYLAIGYILGLLGGVPVGILAWGYYQGRIETSRQAMVARRDRWRKPLCMNGDGPPYEDL